MLGNNGNIKNNLKKKVSDYKFNICCLLDAYGLRKFQNQSSNDNKSIKMIFAVNDLNFANKFRY